MGRTGLAQPVLEGPGRAVQGKLVQCLPPLIPKQGKRTIALRDGRWSPEIPKDLEAQLSPACAGAGELLLRLQPPARLGVPMRYVPPTDTARDSLCLQPLTLSRPRHRGQSCPPASSPPAALSSVPSS